MSDRDDGVHAAAASKAIGAPVLAGAFFTQRNDDINNRTGGPLALPAGVADLATALVHRLRQGRMPHWLYLAVTPAELFVLELVSDPVQVKRTVRRFPRSEVSARQDGSRYRLDLDLAGETLSLEATAPGPAASDVAALLTDAD